MNYKTIEFEAPYGKVCIPISKITGICNTAPGAHYPAFVATGAEFEEGGENGWYISESYEDAQARLEAALTAYENTNRTWFSHEQD
jgi:hypothetical protein